jgi:tripartite-type tricarboxylate transporter receptor subunit TctC
MPLNIFLKQTFFRRNIMKRSIIDISLVLMVFGLALGTVAAQAQNYPNRPIQLIVPNVAGSTMDITARALAEDLGKILGTQIITVNKPGAGTTVGTDALAKSKKDGYTLGYPSNALIYARILNPEMIHFDPDKDIEPLGLHAFLPLAIGVQANSPWKTFNDLIEYAKKSPGALRVNTIGIGSGAHFNLEIIQSLTGAQFTHVPFKGGESVTTALLGGHVEMTCDTINKLVPYMESGELRTLVLSTKMSEFPKIPTLSELGFKQEMVSAWFSISVPSGLPEDIKTTFISAVEKAIRNPGTKARIEKLHFVVEYKSPAQLKKISAEEYERAVVVAKKAGLIK